MKKKVNEIFLDFENKESLLNFTLVSNTNNSEDIEITINNFNDNDLTDSNTKIYIIVEHGLDHSRDKQINAVASNKVRFSLDANMIPWAVKYNMYLKIVDNSDINNPTNFISGAMILDVTQGASLNSIATSDLSMSVNELKSFVIDIIKKNPSTGGINLETDPVYTSDKDKLATKEEIKNKQELTQVIEFGTGLTFTNAIDALAGVGPTPKSTNFVILKDNDANEISLNVFKDGKPIHLLKIPLGKNHFDFTVYDTTASQDADAPNKNENDLSFNKQTGELYFLDNTKTWLPMNLNSPTVDLSDYVTTQVLNTLLSPITSNLGDVTTLSTKDKSNVVKAINSLNNEKQDNLDDAQKLVINSNAFTDINKLALESNTSDIQAVEDDIGDLTQLPTNVKTDIVNSIKELWQTGETLEHKLENEIKQMLDIAHIVEFDSAASDPTALVSREQARNSITGLTSSNRAIALIIDKVAGTTFIDIWDSGKWLVGGSLGALNLTPYLTKSEAALTYATKTEVNAKQSALTTPQKAVINANPFTNTDKTAINDNGSNISKNSNSIGTLANLPTTEKGSLVGSIAELDQDIKNLPADDTTWKTPVSTIGNLTTLTHSASTLVEAVEHNYKSNRAKQNQMIMDLTNDFDANSSGMKTVEDSLHQLATKKQSNLTDTQKAVINGEPFTSTLKTKVDNSITQTELNTAISNLPTGGSSSPAFETRNLKAGDTNADKSTLKSGDLLHKSDNFYLYDGHNIYWIGTKNVVFEGVVPTQYKVKIIEDGHTGIEQNNIIIDVVDNNFGVSLSLDIKMSSGMYGSGVNIIKRTGENIALIGLNDSTGNYYNTNGVQFKIDKSKPSAIIYPTTGKQFKSTSGTFPSDLINLSGNFIVQIVAKIVTPDPKTYEINLGTFELASIKEMQSGFNEPETIKRIIDGAENTFTINHNEITSTLTISELRITVLNKVHA